MSEPSIEQMTDSTLKQQRARQQRTTNGAPRPSGPPALVVNSGIEIYRSKHAPPDFVIAGILPVGLTIAGGRPKTGKSWLALQVSVAVAFGESALGTFHTPRTGRVTYLALEEPASRTHHRLRKIVPEPDIRLENISFVYAIQPLMSGGAAQLDAHLIAHPSEMVVIDTLLAFTAAHSERKDIIRGDYSEVNELRRLAEKHCTAILCIAHTRKAAGDAVDAVIGTSGVTAACDSVWQLKRLASGEASLEIKGREIEEVEYELKFNHGEPFGWSVNGKGAEVGLSQERRDILAILHDEGAQTPASIARLLGNKNAVTVRRLVQNLAHDGLIRKQDSKYLLVNGVNGVNNFNVS